MKAYIKYARGIPKMVTDIQANLQGPLPKTYVELGIADFGGFADFYTKYAAAAFASVANPDLQKQLTDADTNAATAMTNLKNYLIGLRKTATDKYPLGKDLFAAMLKDTEGVEIPIVDIEAAGRADLQRNTQALKDECATYLPKGTARRLRREDVGQQTQGWIHRSGARPARRSQEIRPGQQCGDRSQQRRGVGGGGPGLQSFKRGFYPDGGAVR